LYREKAEVEKWREHDPIRTFTDRCLAEGLLTAEDIAAIERRWPPRSPTRSPTPRPGRWRVWTT
jgi:TPP-dependent pyruvate/acetoin dehydrogenase alpha subunit